MKLVYLEWIDACSHDDNSWTEYAEIENKLSQITTCGIVLYEDDNAITVANSVDGHTKKVSGSICIPKCCIKVRNDLFLSQP